MSQNKDFNISVEEIITLTDDEEIDSIDNTKSDESICLKLNKSEPKEKFINAEINNEFDYDKIHIPQLLNKKRSREEPKKRKICLEFKLFNNLVDKYGIDKVLISLCRSDYIYSNKSLDLTIDKIIDSCDKGQFIINIIKTYHELLEEYMHNDTSMKKALSFKNNFDQQRIITNNQINSQTQLTMLNFEFNVNNIVEIPMNKNKDNMKGLECHFHQDEEGNVYKYKIMYLLGKLAVFKCADDKCNGHGVFDLDKNIFNVEQRHNMKYSEHKFVVNGILEDSLIYNEMKNNNYKDAQIILEGNNKYMKFYS